MKCGGRQRVAALTVPEPQRRRALRQHGPPLRRRLVRRCHVLHQRVVPLETVRLVCRAFRVTDLTDRVAGFLRQHIRRVGGPHDVERTGVNRHREARDHPGDDRPVECPGDAEAQPGSLARRRDELWRRRLARGEQRRQRVATRQGCGDSQRACRALRRIGFEAPENRAFDRLAEAADDRRGTRDRPCLVLVDELSDRRGVERAPPREELVDHEPQREDVASGGDLPAEKLLGRHVSWRPRANVLDLTGRGKAEVHHAYCASSVQHDVGRFQVPMDDAALMRRGHPGAQLPCDGDRFVLRESSYPTQ